MKMRRENLVIASLAVPSVTALSLANFQQITSAAIPVTCQLTYNSQIPSCTKSDFENGCSETCQAGLKFLASGVTGGCSNVIASSNTLLGIVMNGGIIQALCPATTVSTSQTKTAAPRTTISPIIVSSSSSIAVPATSVTIPTNSAGVTAGFSSTTTSAPPATTSSDEVSETQSPSQQSSTLNPPSSTSVSSTSSSATSTVSPVSSSAVSTSSSGIMTASSAGPGPGNLGSVSTSTSAAQAAKSTAPAGKDTGGGSPFDIQSSAHRVDGSSACYAFIIAVWASMLLGR